MKTTPRLITDTVLFALNNNPVVFVNGPRQAGKSTLVQSLARTDYPADYVSFDNVTQMAAAAASPVSFLKMRKGALIIDEVQMVPELFRALKAVVDEIRMTDKPHSNGRFLLTGSANIMALPKLSEPLVGRMSIKTLYPFSGSEATGGKGEFLSSLFAADFFDLPKASLALNDVIRLATFPEISGKKMRERSEWFDGYLTTILQRDVRVLSELDKISLLPVLLRILATRAGNLINDADIARDVALNPVTSKSYRAILQAMFLTFSIEPWYRNIGKRLVKSSKGYLTDTLLLCHLLDWQLEDIQSRKPDLYGHVVENFVATELLKLLSFNEVRAQLLHFRTSDNKEVDFVLERPDGSLAAIEVKSSDTVDARAFKGLKILKEAAPDDFVCGIVLYAGDEVVPFGDDLFAVPFAALWQ
ncbi:ATP-binding protein [Paremcibacter congregatus]|uniref:ATP-binding protein n=1 Tax=Paremcibacter congregatus TaxID=2043170 RepID=UPI003A8FA7E3